MNKREDLKDGELYDLWQQGKSYHEIGEKVNCSPNTARSRILREKARREQENTRQELEAIQRENMAAVLEEEYDDDGIFI